MVALNLVNRSNKRRQTPEQVSELTTNRLSVYLRCLNELDAAGVQTISSQALAEQFHLNAAQIRKDLAYFGEFGVRGVGYYVKELRRHLRQILGLDRQLRVVDHGRRQPRSGARRLSRASGRKASRSPRSSTPRTRRSATSRAAACRFYDIKDLKRIARRDGSTSRSSPCRRRMRSRSSIRSSPPGIKAILNFSPGALKVPAEVKLKSVDLTVSLESLSFYLAQEQGQWLRRLSHVDRRGRVKMVDVGDKPVTNREAVARGEITMSARCAQGDPRRARWPKAIRCRRRGWRASWPPSRPPR